MRQISRSLNNCEKSLQNKASRTQSSKNRRKPPNSRFGSSLGSVWAASWTRLGRSWPPLGRSWALLGPLGRLSGAFWASLRRSWASLGCLLGRLGASWAHLERFGIDFEGFQTRFGRSLNGVRTLKSAALLAAPGVLKTTELISIKYT